MEFVQRFLGQFRPPTVLDLGCNTGAYSRLAAAAGSLVVAADADADSVDVLYREQKDAAAHVLPLRLDIASPSPAVGYMNCERSAFLDRADFDAVFALALLHHLLIISRIPLSATASMFSALTQRWLVIEFVGRSDPMFQHLLALREDIYAEITSEHFEKGYSQHFTIIERQHIPDTDRLLYVLERNSSSTH